MTPTRAETLLADYRRIVEDEMDRLLPGTDPRAAIIVEAMRSGVAPEKQLVRTGPAPKPVPAPGLY